MQAAGNVVDRAKLVRMTTPRNSAPSAPAAPSRFAARAVDLGAVKEAADARARAREEAASGRPVAPVAQVTAESFEQDLVIRSTQVPVIVQLGSSRAPGSDEMSEGLAGLAAAQQESGDPLSWVFRYVDVDTVPEIAQAFGVQAVPTVLALAEGRPLTSFEGTQPSDQLVRFVEAVLQATAGRLPGLPGSGADTDGDAQDPRFADAADALDREDYPQAVAVYDSILADSGVPAEEQREARAARATAVLLGRTGDGSGDDIDQLLVSGRRGEAFDILIGRLAATAGDDRDAVRTRLLELFSLYDPADPEVIDARTRMASALF